MTVQDPYVRLAPPNAPATGAFMVIKNNGDKDVKMVLKADNPVSKVTELHTHLNDRRGHEDAPGARPSRSRPRARRCSSQAACT